MRLFDVEDAHWHQPRMAADAIGYGQEIQWGLMLGGLTIDGPLPDAPLKPMVPGDDITGLSPSTNKEMEPGSRR